MTWLLLKSRVRRALGKGLSFVLGQYFLPPVLPAGTRRLSRPATRPWVSWGLVQHVWHLVMDPNTSRPHLLLLHVHAHPARADASHLEMGTASAEQHEAGTISY